MLAYLLTLLLTTVAPSPVNLTLEQHPCIGTEVMVDIIATSQDRFTQRSSAVSVLIEYSATRATLLRVETETAGVDWFVAGFLRDPDDINQDIGDGLAVLTLLSQLTEPAIMQTRCGTVLATLVFSLSDKNAKPVIELPLAMGAFGVTEIYGDVPGVMLLGEADGIEVSCKSKTTRVRKGD